MSPTPPTLGPTIARYTPPRQGQDVNLAAGVIVAVVGVILAAVGAVGLMQTQLWGLLCLTLGVIALPVGIWGYRVTRRQAEDGVTIHENGLEIIEDGVRHRIPWTQIDAFYGVAIERFSRNKFNFSREKQSSMGLFHYYRITTVDGGDFRFDNQIMRIADLGEQLAAGVMPHAGARMQARLDGGETVDLGPLSVSAEGVTSKKRGLLRWDTVARFAVDWERGQLIVEEQDNPVKWGKFQLGAIANLDAFLAYAAEHLPLEAFDTENA